MCPQAPPPGSGGEASDAPSAARLHPGFAPYLPGVAPDLALQTAPGPGQSAVGYAPATLTGGFDILLVAWHFGVAGGSFGQRDASTWAAACALAEELRRPVVAVTSSGGTRLTEGAVGLLGMARATLARDRLAAAGLPLIVIAAPPTTGGVWVTIGSRADLRCAVAGGIVGFAGPRVVAAVTGAFPGPESHHAESAGAAGLVDAVLQPDAVGPWLLATMAALAPPCPPGAPAVAAADSATGESEPDDWDQVVRTRSVDRPAAGNLLDALLGPDVIDLAAPRGDRTVRAVVGRIGGQPVIGVALAAARSTSPTPDGYRLLQRAAATAGRLRLPLLTLVDTPGAAPGPGEEADGLAAVIGDSFAAVLAVQSPTVGVVVGEGGSGGALAALVCDRVLATPDSYLAALVPEGAGAALHRTPPTAARLQRLTPPALLADRVIDAVVGSDTEALRAAILLELGTLGDADPGGRFAERLTRWGDPPRDRLGGISAGR